MSRYQAEKHPKATVECSICGTPREVGLYHAQNIEAGKSPNVCRSCIVRASPVHELAENEVRRKGPSGKYQIRVRYYCIDCGKEGYRCRHKHTERCKTCANDYRANNSKRTSTGSFVSATSEPEPDNRPPGQYPIPAVRGVRCRGLRDGCPKYWQCLSLADAWPGWTCGDGSPPLKYQYTEESKQALKDHWASPDRDCPNPFEVMSLGINIYRRPRL